MRTLALPVATAAAVALLAGCAQQPSTPAGSSVPTTRSLTPNALAVDAAGNVYIADLAHHVIDKVTADGSRLTVVAGVSGNGGAIVAGPALTSPLSNPSGLAVDGAGNVFLADSGSSQVVAKIDATTRALSIVAGTLGGFGPLVPGPATASNLASPNHLAVDAAGDVFVADTLHGAVVKVDPSGTLSVVAGTPGTFAAPRPGPAVNSSLYTPSGVAVDSAGDVYISDTGNHVVEKVDPSGTLSIIAGTVGSSGSADPGPATDTVLGAPSGLAVDSAGNLYVADPANHVVDMVAPDGTLSIVAGTPGTSGKPTPGPAASSALNAPSEVAVDGSGNVYIADTGNNVVERVSGGNLSVFAGTGSTTAAMKIQTLAALAIATRTNTLQLLMPRVTSAKWLTADHKTAALAILDNANGTLLDLGKQLAFDTNTADLSAAYKAVFSNVRVYSLTVQQVYLAAAADNAVYGVLPQLTSARDDLRARLDGPDAAQDTAALEATMRDLTTQITTITTRTNGLADTVLAYTPDQLNQNRQLLVPAKTRLATANAGATKAANDIEIVQQALGTSSTPAAQARRAVIATASAGIGHDLQAAAKAQAQNDQPAKVTGS